MPAPWVEVCAAGPREGPPLLAPVSLNRSPFVNPPVFAVGIGDRFGEASPRGRLWRPVGRGTAKQAMIRSTPDGPVITVRVVPRAGRSGVAGTRDGALLVRLAAAPVEGAANAELVEVISELLGVPKRAVTIVAGERGRLKRVRVEGVTVDYVNAKCSMPNAQDKMPDGK